MTSQQRTEREASLTHSVQASLPGFVDACNAEVDEVILDQGAFAADYQDDEYKLLGMAIKYAGFTAQACSRHSDGVMAGSRTIPRG